MESRKNRKYLIGIFAIVLLISCNDEKQFKISGKFDNASGELLTLKELTIADVITVDSVKVSNNGKFTLKGKNNKIAFYNLYVNNANPITLVIKPGDRIHLTGDIRNLANTYQVEGSEESQWVKELTEKLNRTVQRIDSLNRVYRDSLGTPNILKTKAHLDSLFKVFENEQIEYTRNFIRAHRGALVTVMALYQQLTPRRALLSPSLHYDLFKEVDSVMMLTHPEADAVQSLHQLMSSLSEEYLRKIELEKRLGIGAQAPDFTLNDFNNVPVTLSSYRGKYLILNFWASWSEPSREFNRELIGIYYRYHNVGLDVLQVSLDKSRQTWLETITNSGLPWRNVTDLKMWDSPVVPLYGIEKLPFTLLLDKDGKILLKNPSKEELQLKLKEIFKY
ncbi:MAG TPA: TlpA disulfide reductase family protein [Bacteroidales bacterium]|nr:TlpA disulfide reductase family protein [Bacteroidales bacterium]HOK98884.1 TlpA disulfide reductase family protein [Bacteroidales bacterium]HPO66159.1 TlpA disulfide reductase family protein [Bacteroidales bacterium]